MESIINSINTDTVLEILIYTGIMVSLSIVSFLISKRYVIKVIHVVIGKTKSKWDDALAHSGFFEQIIYLVPALIIVYFEQFYPAHISNGLSQVMGFYITIVVMLSIDKFLSSFLIIYYTLEISRNKPIKGYLQLVKLVVYIIGSIVAICLLVGVSPWGVLSGIGAFTAVLMFVFKDTILSFVASIQIVANNLFKIGDWIEVEQFGADGAVIDIALHSVKIQNWDKTIVAIPTYKFMENSFKNWQGMSNSGGRRIKRSLFIDLNSIKMCSPTLLEKLKNIELIKEYLDEKFKVIDRSEETSLNKRKLTNIGTFREYAKRYLNANPNIDSENFTFMVRQLQPTSKGLPLEIYVFSNNNNWVEYEGIQSDIFDHLLVALKEFELKLYQEPSGEFGFSK